MDPTEVSRGTYEVTHEEIERAQVQWKRALFLLLYHRPGQYHLTLTRRGEPLTIKGIPKRAFETTLGDHLKTALGAKLVSGS